MINLTLNLTLNLALNLTLDYTNTRSFKSICTERVWLVDLRLLLADVGQLKVIEILLFTSQDPAK